MGAICIKCAHVLVESGGRCWYDYRCRAVTHEPAVDPVTGSSCFKARNSLGQEYHTDDRHPHCRSLNDGSCALYKGPR